MLSTSSKNTRHGSLPGNGCGGFIATIKHPSPGSFIMGIAIEYKRGQKVGECIFLYKTGRKRMRDPYAIFQCRCGNEYEALISSVKRKASRSCGCLQKQRAREAKTTHGLSSHPLYHRWGDIKERCYNPKNQEYHNYGGRGITVCDEWKYDFKAFYDHVMPLLNAMQPGLTIDRENNEGNYEPGNIRWATARQQRMNQRGMY